MKKTILATLMAAITFGASATTFHQPDQEFLTNAAQVGVTQANWDSGAAAKLTFKNAYRFTYSDEMSNGKYVHDFGKATGFDLDSVSAHDVDGEFPMSVILRDRLNEESLVIMRNGKLIDEYYWSGMNKDHVHLQMSVTKSFTSLTLSILAAEGKVDMNAPITKYLPQLKASPGFAKATVQEVADMRSGITLQFTEGKLWDDRLTNVEMWNGVNNYPELKSIVDYAATVDVDTAHSHGEKYDYLDVNTEMLGAVISKVTGKPMADVLEERLWKKVGFNSHSFMMTNQDREAVASGGLNATTRDVALMMDVLVNGGKNRNGEQIISKKFIDNLLAGNDEVRAAWKLGKEAKFAEDAWYKDQIRVFNIQGHKFMAFVGIHGQVVIGEPSTGIVFAMNGAQEEMQAPRTVSMTFLDVVPTMLSAIAKK